MVGNCGSSGEAGNILELLARHDISPTQQRRQIARILFAKSQHLSAEQILEQVNREGDLVSKATVYNTLGLFARKGLVREVFVDPTKVFYDSNIKPHHHFYNVDTGELADIAEGQVSLSGIPLPPEGAQMESVDIVIRLRSKD